MTRQLAMVLPFLLIAGCSTASAPAYSTRVTTHAKDDLVVHVEAHDSLSAETMTRLLLTEAAHTAIDRGAVYLRIDQVVIGDTTTSVSTPARPDPTLASVPMGDVAAASAVDKVLTAIQEVSIERQRSGAVSITIGSVPPSGEHVFEASKLLDELRRGGTAMTPPRTER